jgi:RNA polymerase sigma factor (sigma-70 family)
VDPESSLDLLAKARGGDDAALERLLLRLMPRLRHWASGRLPARARDRGDTDDLVQETVVQTLRKIETFSPRHEGALQAYLRQALVNRIRDAVRRANRRPEAIAIDEDLQDQGVSPLELAIGRESVERYETALATLRDQDREAIIGRIEFGHTYDELARVLDKPNGEAARVAVHRAMLRLAEAMRDAAGR